MNFRTIACAAILASVPFLSNAKARDLLDANGNLDGLISKHAAANGIPESLVRRIIKRESGGRPHVISKGNYGLMQIKLATARGMGYRGDARGLLDADTNMTYAVKYLAGAYRVANGNLNRAVHYYAAGYYYAAKGKNLTLASNDQAFGSFAEAGPDNSNIKFSSEHKFRQAQGETVASSSSLYTGRVDYH